MKIAYVQHPCTPEEAVEIIKTGFDKVLDVRHAPEKLESGCEVFTRQANGKLESKPKRKPRAKKKEE